MADRDDGDWGGILGAVALCLLALWLGVSCSETSSMEREIRDLKDRVEKLEKGEQHGR